MKSKQAWHGPGSGLIGCVAMFEGGEKELIYQCRSCKPHCIILYREKARLGCINDKGVQSIIFVSTLNDTGQPFE